MACAISILLISIFSCSSPNFVAYAQNDTLGQGQLLRDNEQLISAGGIFRLGFFSADSNVGCTAGSRYLGIWFEHIPVYSVWVANRDTPVPDSSGGLTIGNDGKLKITYQGGPPIVINSDVESPESSGDNVTATLLDSGNLVIRRVDYDGKPAGPVLWQSFDYPHSRLLPGMRLRVNLKAKKNWTLNSWSSEEVPAVSAFMLGLWARFFKLRCFLRACCSLAFYYTNLHFPPGPYPTGVYQLLVWSRDEIYWSSGVWQNGSFQSEPSLTIKTELLEPVKMEDHASRFQP
ncbi:hypothetical protein SADUNF_Sadunf19G0032500 [Salix dunnii]|uniref:Bulb-type lectin domain-containing protein n=1 Tax=Salix dunnii TaxID=1413687 RepID=A0A835MF11_9ROSI|nr:hypothetical protein SADUNF_Sadunf19G0032500 [Salix dunnii]